MYSDGTLLGGEGKGIILDGTPGKDAYYTGYHWTKAMCDTCGTMNSNGGINGYGFGRNVYNLYDCAAEFMEDLDKRVTYECADDTYHTVTTKGGSYCCFCYGTIYESSSKLERHSMVTEVLPQPANGRFAVVEKCSLCDYCCTRGWMTVLNACGPSSGIQRSKDAGMSTVATISRIPRSAAPSEPQRQGQQAFVREQGRKALRQTRLRQTEQNRRLRNTSLGLGTSETIGTAQNAEDLSHKSIKERTSIPFPKASQKALLKKDGQAEYSVQKTAQAAGRALRAILAAARSLLAAMMAGGSTVVSMVLMICLIGLLIASPLGIFFSGEDSGTGYTMPEAVHILKNGEFTDRIEKIKAENPHDELDMDNAGNAAMIANWRDVLAIYVVRTTTDDTSPDEVATLTAEKLDILRQIFWDMNAISYWVETISGDEDESDTVILHITVTVKDHLQMADEYRFNTEQRKLLEELMQPEYQELFMALTGGYQDIDLSPEEIQEIINKLPTDLSEERKQVVLTAYQLNYFWGGKSLVLGWDSRWGTPMEVTAAGSSSSGTVRPFGLDCSGFVDWVFYNQSGGQYIIGHGGGASAQHSYCTPISWNNAKPGDLVFYPGDSHVGIVCGFDSSGNILIIHCASSSDNVVVTGKIGFTMIGRPRYLTE